VGYLEPITKKDFNELLMHLKCIDYSCFNSSTDLGVLESITALSNSKRLICVDDWKEQEVFEEFEKVVKKYPNIQYMQNEFMNI
jgi:outer membrane protein assembly factor BamD (BamD/ComL family)